MSSQRKKSGLLAGVTPESYPIGDIALPFTIVLRSVAAGRQISLSFDETLESFTPALDQSSATELVLHVTVPCTHVRFTGAANDAWSVIWNKTNI